MRLSESKLRGVDTRKKLTEINIKLLPGYNKPWIGPQGGLRTCLFSGRDMNIPKPLAAMSCSLDCPGDLNVRLYSKQKPLRPEMNFGNYLM